MNFHEFDITIVGGGCIGASILHELTLRGCGNLALIDQGRGTVSATANSGGMIRVFHENIEHVNLALANHARLKNLHLPETPETNGSLYFFHKRRYPQYRANLERMNEAGYPFEILTPVCGRKRFSDLQWGEDEWAIYEPLGSQLSPRLFADDLISGSRRAGATVIDGFEVQRLSRCRDHYRISGSLATVTTKTLILAGGARLLPRLRDLGLALPLEAKVLTAFTCASTGPVMPNYFDRETLDFACLGRRGQVTFSKPPRLSQTYWRGPLHKHSAEDCYAPNRIGFSGQVAGFPQLSLATGWGGTAFKFALEIGNRVANAVERARPERSGSYATY